jgi:hypothetical protein
MHILPTILWTMGTTLSETGNAIAKLSANLEGHIASVDREAPPDMSVRHNEMVIDMKNDMKRQKSTVLYFVGTLISHVLFFALYILRYTCFLEIMIVSEQQIIPIQSIF